MGGHSSNKLLLTLDLAGTFVFAISGATAGVKRRLDLFGIPLLSFIAGNFGGIARDVLIGSTPHAAIHDWRFPAISWTFPRLLPRWSARCCVSVCALWPFTAAGVFPSRVGRKMQTHRRAAEKTAADANAGASGAGSCFPGRTQGTPMRSGKGPTASPPAM
jgi:hypothetical protein